MYDPNRSTRSNEATGRSIVVGLFDDSGHARDAVEALKDAGFGGNDIGILMRDRDQAHDLAKETGTEAGAGAATGLVGGGLLGGLAGWLVGIGALVIPGVGPFIAAGALGAALTGAAIGAGVGAVGGALVGMGIPKEEADWYEGEVRGGRTMVTVRTDGRYAEARSLMRRYGAYDIENRSPDTAGTTGGSTLGTTTGTTLGTTTGTRGEFGTGTRTDDLTRRGHNDYGTSDRPSSGTGGIGTGSGTGLHSEPPSGISSSGAAEGSNWEQVSPRYRSNWQQRYGGSGGGSWEDLEPNYRYGWEMRNRPEYRDRNWSDVEPQLRRDWEGRYQGKPWDRAAENIREAWEGVADRGESDRTMRSGSDLGGSRSTMGGTGTMGTSATGGGLGLTSSGGNWSDYSTRYRSSWERRYGSSGGRWEDYEPSYRYGWEMRNRPEYRGRQWNDVESDFRSDWTKRNPQTPWEKVSNTVREAWDDLTDRDEGDRTNRGGGNVPGGRTEFGPR